MHEQRTARAGGRLRFAALFLCAPLAAHAGVDVRVLDREGLPVAGVAVYAQPEGTVAPLAPSGPPPTAVMDQKHKAFVPHVLVVQRGTEVAFPNNDTVSHHVYSFSPAKTFELALYKGDRYPPVRFDTAGVVVLGCNIHDGMLGYILVVDTPHFALTDGDGRARLAGVSDGDYAVHVWTPRAHTDELPAPVPVTVRGGAAADVTFRFASKLMPAHDHGATSLTWDRY
ncbi:MAG TPA: methylamine utilization protein [Gammaproteobacteria bacterium]